MRSSRCPGIRFEELGKLPGFFFLSWDSLLAKIWPLFLAGESWGCLLARIWPLFLAGASWDSLLAKIWPLFLAGESWDCLLARIWPLFLAGVSWGCLLARIWPLFLAGAAVGEFGFWGWVAIYEKTSIELLLLRFSVVPPGIEPGTQGFSVLCSTN